VDETESGSRVARAWTAFVVLLRFDFEETGRNRQVPIEFLGFIYYTLPTQTVQIRTNKSPAQATSQVLIMVQINVLAASTPRPSLR
jgi:hypothetical protein